MNQRLSRRSQCRSGMQISENVEMRGMPKAGIYVKLADINRLSGHDLTYDRIPETVLAPLILVAVRV